MIAKHYEAEDLARLVHLIYTYLIVHVFYCFIYVDIPNDGHSLSS